MIANELIGLISLETRDNRGANESNIWLARAAISWMSQACAPSSGSQAPITRYSACKGEPLVRASSRSGHADLKPRMISNELFAKRLGKLPDDVLYFNMHENLPRVWLGPTRFSPGASKRLHAAAPTWR